MSAMKAKLIWPKEDDLAPVHDVDWNDPQVSDLAKLLYDGLHTCFCHAIKKLAESGYTENVVENTVLRCGPFYATNDMVSTIVDRGLVCLRNDNPEGNYITKFYTFENLKQLIEYMMLEMVSMLKKVKPFLSVSEAIWALLIHDLNLIRASDPEMDPLKFSIARDKVGTSLENPSQFETQCQETMAKNVNLPNTLEPSKINPQRIDEKCHCQKRCLGNSHKRDAFQKSFRFDKKAKLASLNLDKVHSPCESLFANKKLPKLSLNLDPVSIPDSVSVSLSSSQKSESVTPDLPKTVKYYLSSIPYDQSKGEHVPKDDKEKIILVVVSQVESLQKELRSWDDWANKKVMQVAKKLIRERPELNSLRAEKDEVERLKKDKQAKEENSAKRLSKMTSALNNANFNFKAAEGCISYLKYEKLALKHALEAARTQSSLEAKKLEEATRKEEESIKKCKSIGTEKSLLDEDLKVLRHELGPKQRDLEKGKRLLAQTEINLANQERETRELRKQLESMRNERERIEALAKAEEERVTKKVEKELKSTENEMKRVQYEISALKLEAETKKIAAMRTGMNWEVSKETKMSKILGVGVENESMRKNRESECVMCFTEEMTVVFVPCGHQVLCDDCNVIHDEIGMNDCPSCRTPIDKRINARFAKS